MATLRYLVRSSISWLGNVARGCPNCGDARSQLVARKYVVTELRRCLGCDLLFRRPVEQPVANARFYNDGSYRSGFTTALPAAAELAALQRTGFRGSAKDYAPRIEVLERLGLRPGHAVFDFGCSWGYGSYQLRQHGFAVVAYEISAARRAFAEDRLQVGFFDAFDALEAGHPLYGAFDCFFSAHVLEHVPCPRTVFAWAERLLRPGGIFVSFTPNGCEAHQARNADWRRLWGEAHPNLIDDRFLRRSFGEWPRLFASAPYADGRIAIPDSGERVVGSLDGPELLFAAVKRVRPARAPARLH